MILLDADVLLLDIRYPRDARFATNRAALDRFQSEGWNVGVTVQALLEVVGILSFNVAPSKLPVLWRQLPIQYGVDVCPDPQTHPNYAGCTVQELLAQMTKRMALGDAAQALQIEQFAPSADCLITWNAQHFRGKLAIPIMTPEEWLNSINSNP